MQQSASKKKRSYQVPKKDRFVTSRRKDSDVGFILDYQYRTGIFETNIISIVSRIEVFIQECISLAVVTHPEKLSVLAGEKATIPVSLFLQCQDKDDVLDEYVALKCQDLMFLKPHDYIDRLQKILSIKLDDEVVRDFIEIKATRDLIVHNRREVNQIYLDKAGDRARAGLGNILVIDRNYFRRVIVTAKRLSGSIQSKIENKYG